MNRWMHPTPSARLVHLFAETSESDVSICRRYILTVSELAEEIQDPPIELRCKTCTKKGAVS